MIKYFNIFKKDENGSAIIFGLLIGLIGIALSYIMLVSTVQSLNVTVVTTVNNRLEQAAQTGINDAVSLINGGYNFTIRTQTNPFTGKDRITHPTIGQTSNIHWEWWVTPFDLTNRSECGKTGVSTHYNCGYYLYSKATMPDISEKAEVTMRAILIPVQALTVAKTGSSPNYKIQYDSSGSAVYRHGVYGLNSVSVGQGVGLYSYYSIDSPTGSFVPTSINATTKNVSLASNGGITITSTRVAEADIAAFNLFGGSGTCQINSSACSTKKTNDQAALFSLAGAYSNIEEACISPLTSFPEGTEIGNVNPTCVSGNVTLTNNTVTGTLENPSILIVNGDLTIDANAQVNIGKAPHFLKIYVRGKVYNLQTTGGVATVNALITAFGKDAQGNALSGTTIVLSPHETGKITYYGSLVAPSISLVGNIDFWQDLNSKYLKQSTDSTYYQLFSVEKTGSVRDNIPISIIGELYSGALITNDETQQIQGVN